MKRIAALALVLVSALAACGDENAPSAGPNDLDPPATRQPTASVSAGPGRGGELDGLTLTLELDETVLASGDETKGRLRVENDTGESITDPACLLAAPRFGIVPAHNPNAELEHAIIVDCAGPRSIPAGEGGVYEHTFRAATISGKPLPPGDYVAAMELDGVSKRLEVPVTVEE